ncbi:unnamed protein product [Thelazia callipaeda]|uniref:alanine transaminase n=1 Tax=Thelazia callipaeda TaxID=103827 RepID=A0A0N5CRU3_THECL|nr:unnamed protein product [Thelazia callipaeda]
MILVLIKKLEVTSARYLSVTTRRSSMAHVLNYNNMNPHIRSMEFAVRGPIVIRGEQLEHELKNGQIKSFSSIVRANIGDAHDMGQKPITWIRQILACASFPEFLKLSYIPHDVKTHVEEILADCGGKSIGAYTKSAGIECIRKHCANYIMERDGIQADYNNIIISNGASEAIRNILKLFANDQSPKQVGVMIPIPQYPLYSASLNEFNLAQIKYYLDEERNWGLSIDELERAINEAKSKYDVKAICVINPGNPTAQVLTRQNIEEIIRFAHKNKLFILADEVYQKNIHDPNSKFFSFKKVMKELGGDYKNYKDISVLIYSVELASFFSVSKGYMGECGIRSGYAELVNVDPKVIEALVKMISARLCANSLGQIALDAAVNPPKQGDPSYEQWLEETTSILSSMKERASLVQEAYSALEGISCSPIQGAMYAMPKIELPIKAIKKAQTLNVQPDFFYGMQMLEETGICTVPGSGFGQREGTYHFRCKIFLLLLLKKCNKYQKKLR